VQAVLKDAHVDLAAARQRGKGVVAAVDGAVENLRETLRAMPEGEQVAAEAALAYVEALVGAEGVRSLAFTFHRPSHMHVIGSFAHHSASHPASHAHGGGDGADDGGEGGEGRAAGVGSVTRPCTHVDVAVEMPQACFREKDVLNHRYFARRALYLATLARHLAACDWVAAVEWSTLRDDVCKPILLVIPRACKSWKLRLLPCLSPATFPARKLAPSRNNVRHAASPGGELLATPRYNMGVLEDGTHTAAHHLVSHAMGLVPALPHALVLLKVWARQRYGTKRHMAPADWLNGFQLSLLAAHLASPHNPHRRVMPAMSAFQIFRCVIDAMGNSDLLQQPIFLVAPDGSPNALQANAQARRDMQRAFHWLLCDPSGTVNFASRVSKSALHQIRVDAQHTYSVIKSGGASVACLPGQAVLLAFMQPSSLADRFDLIATVHDTLPATPKAALLLDEPPHRRREGAAAGVVARGMGERATAVRVHPREVPSGWRLEQGLPALESAPVLMGVSLASPDTALRLVDKGPSADNKAEALKFRAFWGPKAELRRWKDGTITEAVAWEAPSTERHLIPSRLISFVLQRHLGVDEGAVRVAAGQLDFALQVAGKDPASSAPALSTAFERLASLLRQLPSLPLSVVALHSLSPATRGASAFPPSPCPPPSAGGAAEEEGVWRRCVDPVPVAVQLEASSKWPDDPEALRLTRHAFCLQIASSLQEAHGVAVEAARGAVDVMMDGFVFRLVLLHDYVPPAEDVTASSSSTSLTPLVTPSPLTAVPTSPSAFSETHRTLQHHSTLNGLTGRHPTFSPIARLAKRWVAAHLFSSHLKEEAVELLVAHTLTAPNPLLLPTPKSRLAGLLRFFRLVASYDWLSQPLIVDVNSAFSPEDVQQIQARFDERLPPHKDTLGSSARSVAKRLKQSAAEGGREGEGEKERRPAMCIATPYDRDGAMWTHHGPSVEALERLCAFAQSAAQVLAQMITGEGEEGEEGGRKTVGKGKEKCSEKHRAVQWKSLFLSPLSTTFDLIIRLHPASLPHHNRVLFPSPKALATAKGWLQVPSSLTPADPSSSTSLTPSLHRLASAGAPLLIGFNPTALLLTHLQERFGSVLTFWFDGLCGSEVIGATWRIPIGASADGGAAPTCLPRRAQQAHLLPCSPQSEQEGRARLPMLHTPLHTPSPFPSTLFPPFHVPPYLPHSPPPYLPHPPPPYLPLSPIPPMLRPTLHRLCFLTSPSFLTHLLLSPPLRAPLTCCSRLPKPYLLTSHSFLPFSAPLTACSFRSLASTHQLPCPPTHQLPCPPTHQLPCPPLTLYTHQLPRGVVNVAAIIDDISIMGAGLVVSVHVRELP
ncbi:unnamed protein product, partial [Closterium sp. NIES-54]